MPEDGFPQVLIAGAGLCGLSCAYHLGTGYALFEQQDEVGGKARSFQREGFTFDITGHWLHLHDAEIRKLVTYLLGDELTTVERRAEIHLRGMRTPYPFQANTHGLPTDVIMDCVLGYFRARELQAAGNHPEPRSFDEYIRQRMGNGIAEHFMIPYNTKMWTVPPSEMGHTWCGRFVPIPEPAEVLRGALEPADSGRGLGYNSSFLYPKAGGIGRLANALRHSLSGPVITGTSLEAVRWKEHTCSFGRDLTHPYNVLVSTLPLTDLVDRLESPPSRIVSARQKLRATSVTYWDVGLPNPGSPDAPHWIYYPEPHIPFYRSGSASAAISSTAPEGSRSHYVEVSHRRGTACSVSDEEIIESMRKVDLMSLNEEPVVFEQSTIDCAYVIMDHDYGSARKEILDWLRTQKILSVGRYGAWTYDSMEGAMIQGKRAAHDARSLLQA